MAEFLFVTPQEIAKTTILGGNVDIDKYIACPKVLQPELWSISPSSFLLTVIIIGAGSLHFYMFFMPYFVMFKRPFVQLASVCFFLSGPFMASMLTSSVNEQPAVWCFFSTFQAVFFGISVRYMELYKQPVLETIHHKGAFGEKPMTYRLVPTEDVEKEYLLARDSPKVV